MSTKRQLLREIKAFLKLTGLPASSFGLYAVGNSRLVSKLEAGGTISIDVADRVRAYIAAEAAAAAKKAKAKEKKKPRPLGRGEVCPI